MKSLRWCCLLGLLAYGAMGRSQSPLIPPSFYAVQGAPFTATVETSTRFANGADGEHVTQRILRDRAGRQRYEAPLVDGVMRSPVVRIFDVVAGKSIKLDTNAKTADVAPMRVGSPVVVDPSQASSLAPANATDGQTLLGTREIAGLEAWGQRTVQTWTRSDGSPVVEDRELWLSTHYRMPVMQVMRSERGKTTQTVVSFDSGEPDEGLFRVPDGYTSREVPPAQESAPGILRVGGDVLAPVVLKAPEAEFSDEARRKGVNGGVLVYLVVDEKGMPQDVKVLRGAGMGLDEKAVEAVKRYRFKPAMRDGVPVKVEMNVQINFNIYSRH